MSYTSEDFLTNSDINFNSVESVSELSDSTETVEYINKFFKSIESENEFSDSSESSTNNESMY